MWGEYEDLCWVSTWEGWLLQRRGLDLLEEGLLLQLFHPQECLHQQHHQQEVGQVICVG